MQKFAHGSCAVTFSTIQYRLLQVEVSVVNGLWLCNCNQKIRLQRAVHHLHSSSSLRMLQQQSLNRMGSKRSQIATDQHSSPIVHPVKRVKVKSLKQKETNNTNDDPEKAKASEHRIDVGDEHSDLLGYDVFSGKLALLRRTKNTSDAEQTGATTPNQDGIDAKLSSKALVWGSQMLCLEDVVSVTYNAGLRHFTVHAYLRKKSRLSCIFKLQRSQKDFCFLASSPEEAVQWVSGFADQQCFVKCLPHPMVSSKKHSSELLANIPLFDQLPIRCKSPPRVLVILNPRSGHGRSSKVFHGKVEPIFQLAGFKMEVVKTTSSGHARKLASTVDFSTCPDGIICVGGDGIVNEVLNGLLSRDHQKEAISVPIGIIPAGSDNSLVWTILGVRDPISAAMTIVKGGLTATDVFAVEWIQTGVIHYGTTVSYFGFLSDVLELSEKYQKRFGPLRYFVAGFLKFLCLPKYSFELEYLPTTEVPDNKVDMSDLYTDIMRRSSREVLPRASSLSSIDSIITPSRMSADLDTTGSSTLASSEPSEFIRCLDPKSKRLSLGRTNQVQEPEEVIHPQPWARTRSKSRTDKAWTDSEDISSTISDPGPVWDAEPKWDHEPPNDAELVPSLDEKWVVRKGAFLGVLVCNHSCRTVQSLSSQVVAPRAVHDDNALDLLLVQGSGRFRLLRFFILLQFGRHLSLPYVEYVKVKSVKIRGAKNKQNGCGIDGELVKMKGQVMCSLLAEQCRLIGRPARDPV